MAKFYVNSVTDVKVNSKTPFGQMIIGLFKQCKTEGRGNFCGYYASEYYIDTEIYAYYVADCPVYRPEYRISEVITCDTPIKFKEVSIGSHMWTYVIEAETVEEAIELFTNAKWRRWSSSEDEYIQTVGTDN